MESTRIYIAGSLFLAFALSSPASAQRPGVPRGTTIPWTLRDRLAAASFDRLENAPPVRKGRHVIRNEEQWRRALTEDDQPGGQASRLPNVDWKKMMVLAAGMGRQPTGGYRLRITDVKKTKTNLVVTLETRRPAPGEIVTQALTWPSDTVVVPATTLAVRWVERDASANPGNPQSPRYGGSVLRRPSRNTGLATSVFTFRESGGIAGFDRQTVIRLAGRPVTARETGTARDQRDVQVTANRLRALESQVRNSGFLDLKETYGRSGQVRDGMARTIRVLVDQRWKTVTVHDGSSFEPTPAAFETVWNLLQEESRKR